MVKKILQLCFVKVYWRNTFLTDWISLRVVYHIWKFQFDQLLMQMCFQRQHLHSWWNSLCFRLLLKKHRKVLIFIIVLIRDVTTEVPDMLWEKLPKTFYKHQKVFELNVISTSSLQVTLMSSENFGRNRSKMFFIVWGHEKHSRKVCRFLSKKQVLWVFTINSQRPKSLLETLLNNSFM